MKIDCPHCGVHGSVDNTLLDKKLRCPKCSKVFLVTEDILPEFDDRGMLSQEILYDDESHSPDLFAGDEDLLAAMAEGGGSSTEEDDFSGLMDDESEENDSDDEFGDGGLELDEEEVALEKCSGCGELLHPAFLEPVGSEHLCALCLPEGYLDTEQEEDELALIDDEDVQGIEEIEEIVEIEDTEEIDIDLLEEATELENDSSTQALMADENPVEDSGTGSDFTVGELIKEAWQKTKGVKASVWAAVIAMLVVISGIFFGGMAAFQAYYKGVDPNVTIGANCGLQLLANWISMLMTGGIMLIGVRHVLEQRVTWKMVFAGFSKAFSMTMALILQTILITIGFLLLVIPGIYLSVGYALVLPLILDKGMGPWEALEASRKAIHKKWWTVFGLYLVMTLISIVSAIPLGLGLIWTIPMFFVLGGVLYVRLFGSDVLAEEGLEEELEDAIEEEPDEEVEENEEIEEESDELEEAEEKLEEISEEVESRK